MNIFILYGHTVDYIPVKFELMPSHQETYLENALTNLEIINIKYYQ